MKSCHSIVPQARFMMNPKNLYKRCSILDIIGIKKDHLHFVMLRACAEAAEVSAEASHSPEMAKVVGIPRSEDYARNDMKLSDDYYR